MSLFGSIGKMIFGDPTKGIEKATEQSVAGQREGLDYQKSVDAPVLANRNKAMQGLSDYYMGGPEGQQGFIDEAKIDPFYQSSVDVGEEAVARAHASGFGGGLRGGNINQAMGRNNQNVLQSYIQQKLQGMSGFANAPLNTNSIAQGYGNIGKTQAAGTTASNQAMQDLSGQTLNLGMQVAGAFGGMPMGMPSGGGGNSNSMTNSQAGSAWLSPQQPMWQPQNFGG